MARALLRAIPTFCCPLIEPALAGHGLQPGTDQGPGGHINGSVCDLVLFSTPSHLARLLNLNKPTLRVRYEYADYGEPTLQEVLEKRMKANARFN